MYELKNIGKEFTSKFVWTGPSSYKKRIYRAAVSQCLGNTALHNTRQNLSCLAVAMQLGRRRLINRGRPCCFVSLIVICLSKYKV
jgi:hypothetical protein